jgi:phosphatidylinositol phospholipase C beta
VSTPVGAGSAGTFAVESGYINTAAADIQPESLEKFWEMKGIREKRVELEKKVESLRKKHEKDRKAAKPPKKSHQKLVKRISSKNL